MYLVAREKDADIAIFAAPVTKLEHSPVYISKEQLNALPPDKLNDALVIWTAGYCMENTVMEENDRRQDNPLLTKFDLYVERFVDRLVKTLVQEDHHAWQRVTHRRIVSRSTFLLYH